MCWDALSTIRTTCSHIHSSPFAHAVRLQFSLGESRSVCSSSDFSFPGKLYNYTTLTRHHSAPSPFCLKLTWEYWKNFIWYKCPYLQPDWHRSSHLTTLIHIRLHPAFHIVIYTMKQFQLLNFPMLLFFILLATIDSCFALCNGADAIMCCLTTGPASDPLIALQLLLAGITPPANTSIIGLGCSPVTGSASTWYVDSRRIGKHISVLTSRLL